MILLLFNGQKLAVWLWSYSKLFPWGGVWGLDGLSSLTIPIWGLFCSDAKENSTFLRSAFGGFTWIWGIVCGKIQRKVGWRAEAVGDPDLKLIQWVPRYYPVPWGPILLSSRVSSAGHFHAVHQLPHLQIRDAEMNGRGKREGREENRVVWGIFLFYNAFEDTIWGVKGLFLLSLQNPIWMPYSKWPLLLLSVLNKEVNLFNNAWAFKLTQHFLPFFSCTSFSMLARGFLMTLHEDFQCTLWTSLMVCWPMFMEALARF